MGWLYTIKLDPKQQKVNVSMTTRGKFPLELDLTLAKCNPTFLVIALNVLLTFIVRHIQHFIHRLWNIHSVLLSHSLSHNRNNWKSVDNHAHIFLHFHLLLWIYMFQLAQCNDHFSFCDLLAWPATPIHLYEMGLESLSFTVILIS